MKNLEIIISEIRSVETNAGITGTKTSVNPCGSILISIIFLVSMLTFSIYDIVNTIPYVITLLIVLIITSIPFSLILRKSKYLLLFVLFIAIFNPIIDRNTAIEIGSFKISYGWLSFFTILLRGFVSITTALILVISTGFIPLCKALEKLRLPNILVTQLLFVYRYIIVLLEEASQISNAIKSRGYGNKKFTIKLYAIFIAQLIIKTYTRAEMINMSMISRGFDGEIRTRSDMKWKRRDTFFCIIAIVIIFILRIVKPFGYIDKLL